MTTASEPTNYIYSALSAANIDPELAHNASEQVLNVAGRNITDHVDSRFDAVDKRFDAVDKRFDAVDSRFATLEKDIAQLRETVNKDIAHLSETVNKDIAQLGETVKENIAHLSKTVNKDIAHLNGYLKWLIPFHCALVVGILATLVVNMFR